MTAPLEVKKVTESTLRAIINYRLNAGSLAAYVNLATLQAAADELATLTRQLAEARAELEEMGRQANSLAAQRDGVLDALDAIMELDEYGKDLARKIAREASARNSAERAEEIRRIEAWSESRRALGAL